MSFGNSFVKGLGEGENSYYKAAELARQKVLDARDAERFDQERTVFGQNQTAYKRKLGIEAEGDAGHAAFLGLVRRGQPTGLAAAPESYDPGSAGGLGASADNSVYQGGTRPQAPAQAAPAAGGVSGIASQAPMSAPAAGGLAQSTAAVSSQRASPREMLNARMNLAASTRDTAAYPGLVAEMQTMDRKDDQRNYLTTMQKMASDPAQSAAYAKEIGPAVKAFSEFNGIPSNFHYDPRTKGIVETPYGKTDAKTGKTIYGAAREVPFETMAPYLLAFRSLTSEYGDPETASAQMKNMSDAERAKRVAEAAQTLDSAAKLSGAAAAQTHAGASMISAGAAATSAGAAVMNARTNQEFKNEQVEGLRDSRRNRDQAAQFGSDYAQLTPEQQASPMGKGLLKQFDMANVKNGGTISPRGQDRQADPAKYFTALKAAQESGAYKTPGETRAAVDEMFGIKPPANIGAKLQSLNKDAGQAQKPIVVPPGENGVRATGSAIMGDPNTFQRTSVRGAFGGLSYMYVDPVTGNKFTAEQYNQLISQ